MSQDSAAAEGFEAWWDPNIVMMAGDTEALARICYAAGRASRDAEVEEYDTHTIALTRRMTRSERQRDQARELLRRLVEEEEFASWNPGTWGLLDKAREWLEKNG